METIKEPEFVKVTFNFFSNDKCGSFKFCRPYEVRTDFILKLVEMTPEERLMALQEFLDYGNKGRSCEFHWQGDFYQAKMIDEEMELRQKKHLEKMRSARIKN